MSLRYLSNQLLTGLWHHAAFYMKDSDISCMLEVYLYLGVHVQIN